MGPIFEKGDIVKYRSSSMTLVMVVDNFIHGDTNTFNGRVVECSSESYIVGGGVYGYYACSLFELIKAFKSQDIESELFTALDELELCYGKV